MMRSRRTTTAAVSTRRRSSVGGSTRRAGWRRVDRCGSLAQPGKSSSLLPLRKQPGRACGAMEEQVVTERIRRKLQEVNATAQQHLAGVQDHVNFTLQVKSYGGWFLVFAAAASVSRPPRVRSVGEGGRHKTAAVACKHTSSAHMIALIGVVVRKGSTTVENCSVPVLTANNVVENEMAKFQASRLFGLGDELNEDAMLGRLEGMKDVIEQVNRQFKDPFLPQDRVSEFAKLSPIQLLEETEKAVGDPDLPVQHRQLEERSKELKALEVLKVCKKASPSLKGTAAISSFVRIGI